MKNTDGYNKYKDNYVENDEMNNKTSNFNYEKYQAQFQSQAVTENNKILSQTVPLSASNQDEYNNSQNYNQFAQSDINLNQEFIQNSNSNKNFYFQKDEDEYCNNINPNDINNNNYYQSEEEQIIYQQSNDNYNYKNKMLGSDISVKMNRKQVEENKNNDVENLGKNYDDKPIDGSINFMGNQFGQNYNNQMQNEEQENEQENEQEYEQENEQEYEQDNEEGNMQGNEQYEEMNEQNQENEQYEEQYQEMENNEAHDGGE
jgi:hypothetical protein